MSGASEKAILIIQGPRAGLVEVRREMRAHVVSRDALVRPTDEGAPLRLYERAEEVLDASFTRVPPGSFVRPSRGPTQAEVVRVRQEANLQAGFAHASMLSRKNGYRTRVKWVQSTPEKGGWWFVQAFAETCDDRGPRIGEDGTRCRKHPRHVQRGDRTHSTAPADGHGNVTWSAGAVRGSA